MSMISDVYISGLSGPNPPGNLVGEAASNQAQGHLSFTADTLALMRQIPHNPANKRCTLLGLETSWDGLLQGDYYWVQSSEADNGDTIGTHVRPYNYQGWLWRKLN